MLTEIKTQVTNLDLSKFKVMIVRDPVIARDVGWLTLEKDARVDLSLLQVRDIFLPVAQPSSSVAAVAVVSEVEVDSRKIYSDEDINKSEGEETGPVRRSERKKRGVVTAGLKRGPSRRSKHKKSYKEDEIDDDRERVDKIIADALGDDSDQDPE